MTPVSSKDFATMGMDILPKSIWIEMIQQKANEERRDFDHFFDIPFLPASFCLFVCRARRGCRVALWRSWLQCCVLEAATVPVQWVLGWFGQPSCYPREAATTATFTSCRWGVGTAAFLDGIWKEYLKEKPQKRLADAVFAWKVIVGGQCTYIIIYIYT